jgi:diphthamide synthase (EF-2-diphthine--ammonia ligase)
VFNFRHIVAALHFNENVQRTTHVCKDGKDSVRIMYPKYKMGEEVVRKVAVPPTYSKYKNKLCTHCTIDSVRGFNNSYLFHTEA